MFEKQYVDDRSESSEPQAGTPDIKRRLLLPSLRPLHRRTVNQITYRRNLMAEAVETKCAHPKCTCPVSEGQEYCSQACAEAAQSGSLSNNCGCDHAGCIGAIAA